MPAFNPFRILNDPDLLRMIEECSTDRKRIYVMAHFNHPRELTPEATRALALLQKAGAIVVNQTPMIRGVNDDPDVLRELFNRLSFIGVPPYYVFQCRPTLGNKPYALPVEEAYEVFQEAQQGVSGLARRARFIMSHSSGKVEVVGLDEDNIYIRYHRAEDPDNNGQMLIFERDDESFWLDDYIEGVEEQVG
jgi:L-lysine 2,3-aminomutase